MYKILEHRAECVQTIMSKMAQIINDRQNRTDTRYCDIDINSYKITSLDDLRTQNF